MRWTLNVTFNWQILWIHWTKQWRKTSDYLLSRTIKTDIENKSKTTYWHRHFPTTENYKLSKEKLSLILLHLPPTRTYCIREQRYDFHVCTLVFTRIESGTRSERWGTGAKIFFFLLEKWEMVAYIRHSQKSTLSLWKWHIWYNQNCILKFLRVGTHQIHTNTHTYIGEIRPLSIDVMQAACIQFTTVALKQYKFTSILSSKVRKRKKLRLFGVNMLRR